MPRLTSNNLAYICFFVAIAMNCVYATVILAPAAFQNVWIESPVHNFYATDFAVIGNITYNGNGCAPYGESVQIPAVTIFGCSISDKVKYAKEAGAVGLIVLDSGLRPGRNINTNRGDMVDFPVVAVGEKSNKSLAEAFEASGFVTIQLEPTPNPWAEEIYRKGWFLTVQICVELAYGGLLAYAIYKLVNMIQSVGARLNVGFVFLLIEMVYYLIVIVLWIDPIEGRFYPVPMQTFLIFLQDTWAFSGLLLMVFFWFETVSSYQGLKTSPFLSNRVRIPFFLLALVLNLLPIAGVIVDTVFLESSVMQYIGIITAVLILMIAAFYIAVAVKVVKLLNNFVKANKSKNKIRNLRRTRISIMVSCVLSVLHPILTTIFAVVLFSNDFLWVGFILEAAVVLGLISFIQVHFMGVTPKGGATTTSRSASGNAGTPRSGTINSSAASTKSVA